MYDSLILAQAQGGGLGFAPLLWLAIIPLMYFMVIRPNSQAQKKAKAFRDALKVGDAVITAGGIFGTVQVVDPTSVVLEIAPKTRIRVLRSQVVGQQGAPTDTTEAAEKTEN